MRFGYFFSETFTNLKRNFLMTIAAVSTVAISLLLLGGVQILSMAVDNMTVTWEAQVEIAIFLRADITDGELQALTTDVSEMGEVEDVTYVSKERAYEDYKEMYRAHPEFWQTLPRDALPASLRVSLHDANDTEPVALRMTGAPGVADVEFGGQFIKTLLRVNGLLRAITFGMSIVLMTAAAALIANTIRLGIYARREEIGIMKLVGATNWFIRIPFMLEGIFAALVGAIVSGLIIVGTNALIFSRLGEAITFLENVFTFSTGEILGVLALLLGVGTLVGLIGSGLALRRFLEV
ncbi:MAG: permease-like cell division protein FtsX [Actinomycetota bacterium]